MNLAELLDQVGTYLDDRTDLIDGDPDALWSDDLIVRYLNQAQKILARRAWCIIDVGQPEAGIIVLETGVALYPLHKSVLRVYTAKPEDQEWPLGRYDDVALQTPFPFPPGNDFPDFVVNPSLDSSGRPLGFATDAGTRQMRVYRTPSATENGLRLILKVARLPVVDLSTDDTDAEPEVPEDYHLDLCDYAAGRCLMQPNVDGQSKADGRELLNQFNDAVKEARRDRQRAEMSPATWGFASSTALLDGRMRG